jgi:hypothetical protein
MIDVAGNVRLQGSTSAYPEELAKDANIPSKIIN